MFRGCFVVAVGMLLGGCGGGRVADSSGASSTLECAPFARQLTGLALYGDAASWWDQARGRYEQSSQPADGAVLVFRRSGRLPYGHVSVVVDTVSGREIRVTQANWVHQRITRKEQVVDVSAGNDWSRVRVWWAPAQMLGSTIYPTYGFILPERSQGSPHGRPDLLADASAR